MKKNNNEKITTKQIFKPNELSRLVVLRLLLLLCFNMGSEQVESGVLYNHRSLVLALITRSQSTADTKVKGAGQSLKKNSGKFNGES